MGTSCIIEKVESTVGDQHSLGIRNVSCLHFSKWLTIDASKTLPVKCVHNHQCYYADSINRLLILHCFCRQFTGTEGIKYPLVKLTTNVRKALVQQPLRFLFVCLLPTILTVPQSLSFFLSPYWPAPHWSYSLQQTCSPVATSFSSTLCGWLSDPSVHATSCIVLGIPHILAPRLYAHGVPAPSVYFQAC